ncbi:4-alpha-glucanotransferase [Rapidithrix thailandica]|uniref:4-alpha-glucanotransferase n=1 Tax=Rapidithrix thailandica TaxID=413964 RepID=A0AAW9S0F0_9BACT
MIRLHFQIHYHTQWGQRLFIIGNIPELGSGNPEQALEMLSQGEGSWHFTLSLDPEQLNFPLEYRYIVRGEQGALHEWGENRKLQLNPVTSHQIEIYDQWRAAGLPQNVFYTAPFANVFMNIKTSKGKPGRKPAPKKLQKSLYRFQIQVPQLSPQYQLCLLGSDPALGAWQEEHALVLDSGGYPFLKTEVSLEDRTGAIEYKYGIYDRANKRVLRWEYGENRRLHPVPMEEETALHLVSDEQFRDEHPWKAAGVAIPVFSLRSKNSLGVGEFLDLKLMVDWAKKVGLKMIQVLPVNDTVALHTWLDSYPYKAISVFALHPIYLNIDALGQLSANVTQEIILRQKEILNRKEAVDYQAVMKIKSRFYKLIFDEVKEEFLADKDFQRFFKANEEWLRPYAAFSYLRDLYGTTDYREWHEYAEFDVQRIEELTQESTPHFPDIAVHYFIQYHLHKQLLEASEYARDNGVVLKGDIPIGISRFSVDAWMYPDKFNLESQAGAPPDAFSLTGQNWQFPTYNWPEMAKDQYAWWRKRMQKMSEYFDVYRIDHILGFFRIWEIPVEHVDGLLGYFNPSMPFHKDELTSRGIWFDYDRLCKPYIREHMLADLFGEERNHVVETFLDEYKPGHFQFKKELDTQRKIDAFLEVGEEAPLEERAHKEDLKAKLFSLLAEVIFLEAPFTNGEAFNPRHSLHTSYTYRELDHHTQQRLNELYIDYFYKRHEEFWKQEALKKLPVITQATNMLVCGEDLGMVPDCVPPTMRDLGLLTLEIQRMPKNPQVEFGHPKDYPYMSVCSTSSHDMSTVRGWWEEDRMQTQRFYNHILGHHGNAPYACESWIVRDIIVQHLYSPSMWAVFPWQDLLGMDEHLRRPDVYAERINVPGNPRNYWKYRMHINLEELMEETNFNTRLKELLEQSGRNL